MATIATAAPERMTGVAIRMAEALHVAVLNATRRLKDEGLRDRGLAAEGRHVAEEWHNRVGRVFTGTWRDEGGHLKCLACGGWIDEKVPGRGFPRLAERCVRGSRCPA